MWKFKRFLKATAIKSFQVTVVIEESLQIFEETSENSGEGEKKHFRLLGQNVY